ncbi:hypothetical protein Bhyg_02499 [Pseudolycoriella hygida]|uniref:Uncharacterized protein n=1 Tax=Pseudolycoriella hygida TaxID=35572 RepID=A0A9Q0NC74_9DIPT|nr:hypothetical protein Bhyg_02499 [Pseudolycoriella hygida]
MTYAQNYKVDNTKLADDKMNVLRHLIKKQIKSAAKMGLLMSSIKVLFNSFKLFRNGVLSFITSFFEYFDYQLFIFFVLYGTFYQLTRFLLNEFHNETTQNSFLAGLVAGTAYYLSPRYYVFAYAFTTVIELLNDLCLSRMDQSSKLKQFVKNISWFKIFIYISIPTFGHWKIFKPWMLPKIMDRVFNNISNDRMSLGSRNYAKFILGI